MTKEQIFLELIESLESERIKFLNRTLRGLREEEFVKKVEKISYYVDKITNDKIRYKVRKFVNSVLSSSIYKVIIEERKNKLEKEKRNKKINEEKNLAKFLVDNCKKYLKEYDFDSIDKIYNENKILIHNYEPEFADFWVKLPRNIDTDKYPLSLKAELIKRKIKYLIHFTPIENLESILINGLMSIKELNEKELSFINNDKYRLDGKTDCISLSIEYPNRYLFDKFKLSFYRKYCILFLNAQSILLNNYNKKYYVYCNAAREDAIFWLRDNTLTNDRYFTQIFLENNTDKRKICSYSRTTKQLKSYLPTNEQAEILFSGTIPPKYIIKVAFECNEDIQIFKKITKNKEVISTFNLVTDDLFFKNSRDSIQWEDR